MTTSDTELCYLSATEVLARFKARSLSPVEYLNALIARAEATEPKINAFCAIHFDKAMGWAKQAEARYASQPDDLRPLEGLPIAIKGNKGLAGEIVTNGSLYFKDNVSTQTHYSVQRLFDAGAYYHAQTTTPEFCGAGTTDSRIHGTTRTPWGLDYTSGGSSGGAGASLAAGSSPLATGSDIGGSIRIPAACCGVVGYKPPHGRNPTASYDMYNATGPMGRTVADVALMQNVMCGPHPHLNASLRPRYELPMAHEGLEGLKIGWSMDLNFFEIDEHVRKNTLKTLEVLSDLGAELVEVNPGWNDRFERAVVVYLDHLFGGAMAETVATDPTLASNWGTYFAEQSGTTTSLDFVQSYRAQEEFGQTFGDIVEECYAFICPTLGSHEVAADIGPHDLVHINAKAVDSLYGWVLTHPFNMLGRCPVLSVPSGIGENGLPTGIQIVARHLDDERVFRVGQALEDAQPWLNSPENRPTI